MNKHTVKLVIVSALLLSLFGGQYFSVNAYHDATADKNYIAPQTSSKIFLPLVFKKYTRPAITVTTFPVVNNANMAAVTLAGACENGLAISLAVTDVDSAHTVNATRTCSAGAWTASSLDLTTLNDGTLTATATQTDGIGNLGIGTKTAFKDVVAPTVTVTTFPTVNNANMAAVTLAGACENSLAISLAVTDVGFAHTVNATPTCSAGSWTASSIDLTTLKNGTLTATATQTDNAGNLGIGTKTASKDVVTPRNPLYGFGVALARRPFTDYSSYDITSMRFGWYVDYNANANPPTPYGMEYAPTVRVKQLKVAEGGGITDCRIGDNYVTPYEYIVSPSISSIQSMATQRPGMTWVIGNEIERIDFGSGYCSRQDEILPELYAHAYHDIYTAIKAVDQTAKVAIGSMIEFTPLREQYLDRVWAEYSSFYQTTMPVDVWNIHLYMLQENSCSAFPTNCWGAGIPAGLSATSGEQYTFLDNKDFTKTWAQILTLRMWMKNHGQKDKPLITTEYGVNFPAWFNCPNYPDTTGCPFSQEEVRDSMMYPSFDAFLNQTSVELGDSFDGNRLLQRWIWWSADYDDGKCVNGLFEEYFGGALFYSGLGPSNPSTSCIFPAQGLTSLGIYWRQYVQNLP